MIIQQQPFRHLLALISITIILSSACNSNPPKAVSVLPEQLLTSIRTDSFAVYPFAKKEVLYIDGFIFSPFEKNKVWVTYQVNESFEIDLESGQQTPFSQKFGHDFFKTGLKTVNIIPDPQDTSVCWFFSNSGGVFRYNHASHQGQFFNVANGQRGILCLSFYAGQVFIGTSKGLWWYERSSGQCRPVDYSPGISIERMDFYPPGKIIVGAHYVYDCYNGCWEFSENHPAYLQKEDYPDHYSFPLPTFGGPYRFGADTREIWASNDKYWVSYDRASTNSKVYKPLLPGQPVAIRMDDANIYLLYPDRFAVVSKVFLIEKNSGDQALIQKFIRLKHLADSLHPAENEDLTARKTKMFFLKKHFQTETDSGLINALNMHLLSFFEFTDETNLKRSIADVEIDTGIKKNLYATLLDVQIRSGKLHAGLKSFQNYQKEFPQSNFCQQEYVQRSWQYIEKTVKKIDSLDHSGLAADELLWAKGHVVYDLCVNCMYFEGEACYDVTLADSIYKIIPKKFPTSPRAEDADYALINNSICHEGEDGSEHPEEIVTWKKFLEKYPNTVHKPQVLGAMAWALHREEADLVQGLRWLEEAILLSNEPASLQSMKEEFQAQLDNIKIQVTISLKKSKVRTGEPVELVFKVKNTASNPIKIPLINNAAYPNFSVVVQPDAAGISCVKPIVFRESKLLSSPQKESDWKERTLKPGEVYHEIWDITQTARKYSDIYLGGYVFDQPGKYQIQARCLLGRIDKESEPVWVIIE